MRSFVFAFACSLLVGPIGGCSGSIETADTSGGTMKGVVTYSGPLPCSEDGHVVGDAVIALYSTDALPPPTGFGLDAHKIAVVSGDVLFAQVTDQIPVNPDGSRACPAPGPSVQVSAVWNVDGMDAGVYQARAWFDYDGGWRASSVVADMVSKGDIAGGAISNVANMLAGDLPQYVNIEIGTIGQDGRYEMPETGFVRQDVDVALGLPIPTNRPYFHISSMRRGGDANGVPSPTLSPTNEDLAMPSDLRLYDASTLRVHESLYWLQLQTGVPESESVVAMQPPYVFQLGDPLMVQRYDVNRDGIIDAYDHITGTSLPVAALGPVVRLMKARDDKSNRWLGTQTAPLVLMNLVVIAEGMTGLTDLLSATDYVDPVPNGAITGFIRPTAVCLEDAKDPNSKTVIVTPHVSDSQDPSNQVIGDEEAMRVDTAEQLGRSLAGVKIVYGCLVPGKFGISAVYPATGQTWRVPNESGVCLPGESKNGDACGSRKMLESQSRAFEIGPAVDPSYCQAQRKALSEPDPIRDYCLTASERAKYIDGTLWGGAPSPL